MSGTSDLTVIYYTANVIPEGFGFHARRQLKVACDQLPIICVSHKPVPNFAHENIVVDLPRHHLSIYRQALIGARAAKTKYIALCEDDVLYSPEHFKRRPQLGKFAYNMNYWNMTTWDEPIFTQKLGGRRNLGNLICERDLFIEAMEERFAKYKISPHARQREDGTVELGIWAEPSKYERQLGVTVREYEAFYTNPPNIMFSHETALSFGGLGRRKRAGEIRATTIPYWGEAEHVRSLYDEKV